MVGRGRQLVDSTRRWYQHPFVVFIIPLVTLLCLPHIYNMIVTHGPSLPYNEAHLQEIAALLDDIYTTLANMTFIPPTSVKSGPHQINLTAIPCKRDPAVLRLMEILPYVDSFEVQEPDWMFGGHFMDYRRQDHLEEGCDPFRASSYWDYMTPHTIALTNWGTGGWNNDRTWVLMYDTKEHAMRVYDGEDWIGQNPDGELNGFKLNGVGIFTGGIEADKSRINEHWEEWFDPPTLLKRLKVAFQTAAWSPWETSNREDGWGVDGGTINHLLHKNGWPETFNPDQFNADFIRARQKRPRRGHAEDAFKRIEDLQDSDSDRGYITRAKDRLARYEEQLAIEKDEQEQRILRLHVQQLKWDFEQGKADLEEAEKQAQELCPDGVCYSDEDASLWQFRALEKEYEKAKHTKTTPPKCQEQIEQLPAWAPPDPHRLENCIAQVELEMSWLFLAYSQSKADALEYCARANKSLLSSDTLVDRVKARIAKLERSIARDTDSLLTMANWRKNVPQHATKALEELRIHEGMVASGRTYARERVQWFEDQFAEGGDKAALWRCLDDPKCV